MNNKVDVHEILRRKAQDDKLVGNFYFDFTLTRQGKFVNASRRIHEFIKEFSRKHQRLFQKVLHLFEKVLSSV